MTILVALNDAEHALPSEHLGAVGAGNRLTLIRRHLIDALLLAPSCTQRAEDVRQADQLVTKLRLKLFPLIEKEIEKINPPD